jgi:hypothetical protein
MTIFDFEQHPALPSCYRHRGSFCQISQQELSVSFFIWVWESSILRLLGWFELNARCAHVAEQVYFRECHVDFVISCLKIGYKRNRDLQWSNSYWIGLARSLSQIRIFLGFWIAICDLSSNMHLFLHSGARFERFYVQYYTFFPSLSAIHNAGRLHFQSEWPSFTDSPGDIQEIIVAILSRHDIMQAWLTSRWNGSKNVIDAQGRSELAIKTRDAPCDCSSGKVRHEIEHWLCFQLHTPLSTRFPWKPPTDASRFLLHLPVFGSSSMIRCLDSFFAMIPLQSKRPKSREHFITFVSRFLFSHLSPISGTVAISKNCCTISFRVILDTTQYVLSWGTRYHYQVAADIAPLNDLLEHRGHSVTIIRTFRHWIWFDDTHVNATPDSKHHKRTSPGEMIRIHRRQLYFRHHISSDW